MWKCSTPPTSSRWTPTVGVGGQGSPTAPGPPWVGRGAPLPRDPLSLVPGMPQSGQMLAVLGLSLDLIFFTQGGGFGGKGGLLHWSGVVQWDMAGRTRQDTVPTSHKPAARAGGFSSSCKAVADKKTTSRDLLAVRLSFGELSRRGHSSCSLPVRSLCGQG